MHTFNPRVDLLCFGKQASIFEQKSKQISSVIESIDAGILILFRCHAKTHFCKLVRCFCLWAILCIQNCIQFYCNCGKKNTFLIQSKKKRRRNCITARSNVINPKKANKESEGKKKCVAATRIQVFC